MFVLNEYINDIWGQDLIFKDPEILVLTGHDAFVKRRNDIYNIDNYKNSKYFVQSVIEARKYEHNLDNLVIFAGACQSYYEALISAGANFASAPKSPA